MTTVVELLGLQVVIEDMTIPVRALRTSRWHNGRCYWKRVQKKWIKRWGWKKLVEDGKYLQAFDRIVMNSVTYQSFKEELDRRELEGWPPMSEMDTLVELKRRGANKQPANLMMRTLIGVPIVKRPSSIIRNHPV